MKKIILHGYAQDNAGSYHGAGAELTVADDGGENCIGTKPAAALVASHCAAAVPDKAEKPTKAPAPAD